MCTLTVKNKDIYKGNLILLNANHPLKQQVEDSLPLLPPHIEHSEIKMEARAATVLSYLFADIASENLILPVSGFRTKTEQHQIYNSSLSENGKEFTKKYVALPNHSEHQSGLAIDLALKQKDIDFIRPHFPYDGICALFRKKAPSYGFIERYQKEKEEITGIACEPWHFRYVGYPHSEIITENNLSLEEYIDMIKEYEFGQEHLVFQKPNSKQTIEIFYVPVSTLEDVTINLPECSLYQVSGNNVDGCIVTLWRKNYE